MAQDREMLAHVGNLAADPKAEVADRELTDGERLEDAQALGIRERPTDGGVPLAIGFCGDWQVIQHEWNTITGCANTQPPDSGPRAMEGRRCCILGRMEDGVGSADHVVPLRDVEAAAARLSGVVHRTPLLSSTTAAAWVERATDAAVGDGRLYLKAEHLQKTGSFKARGMTNRIATLPSDARERGAITLSAGNAGQAYAWAGRAAGVSITVVMPAAAVRSKVEACLGYGARVVLHGDHVGETFAEMERIRDAEGLAFVHPFDDPAVIAGHGTAGLELLDDLPEVDVVVVGVGGGGLVSGVAAAVKGRRPSARVYGVEPERSNALSLALERDSIITIRPESVADGLNAPFAGAWTLAMAKRHLEGIVLIDDETILAGLRFAVERLKQVLEPAGAAALAAVLAGRIPIRPGERVAVVLSGGNVEVSRLGELIAAAGTFAEAPA